ncbi:MAG: hypothetical protein IH865_05275 [Chloroflexi bacterium]|nr:hypothetical protein [Chloroflexota bacterium]
MGGKNILLRDDPINLEAHDSFRHDAYEGVLKDLLSDVEPPFTIGLFGKWGAGKSTITGHLRSSFGFEDGRTSAFAEIDVWKFQTDAFRRQFLLGVEKELVDQGALQCPRIHDRLDTQSTVEVPGAARFSLERLFVTLVVLAVTLSVSVGLYYWIRDAGDLNPEVAFLTLILAPIFLSFAERVPNLVIQTKESTAKLPAVTADRFEELFDELLVRRLERRGITKVVLVMDNLDRLQSEQAVEVLGSIKTFMEGNSSPFLFVLPCDDEALRKHVLEQYLTRSHGTETNPQAENYANEFLRKFFNVTISLAPFYEEEMWAFAKEQIELMQLAKDEAPAIDRLSRMIGFAFRDSPRRVKQFLNNLAARYLLAKARMEQGILNLSEEPLSILLLAKLMIIEARWLTTFERLRADPGHLESLQGRDSSPEASGRALKEFQENEGLQQFLLATDDISGSRGTLKAYMVLKQTDDEAALPAYDAFRSAAESADIAKASALLGKSERLREPYIRTLVRIIGEDGRLGLTGQARNATKTAIQLAASSPVLDQASLADEIGQLMGQYASVRSGIAESPVETTLDLLGSSTRQAYRQAEAIDLYIEEFGRLYGEQTSDHFALAAGIVKAFANRLSMLSKEQIGIIAEAIETYYGSELGVLLSATSSEESTTALVTPTTIEHFAKSLKREDLEVDEDEASASA